MHLARREPRLGGIIAAQRRLPRKLKMRQVERRFHIVNEQLVVKMGLAVEAALELAVHDQFGDMKGSLNLRSLNWPGAARLKVEFPGNRKVRPLDLREVRQ